MSLRNTLKGKGLIISTTIIIAILLLEIFFRDDLFSASLSFIVTLQTNLPSFTRYIFNIASGLGDPDIILPVYLLILALQVNKYFLVKLGLYICFIGYFLSVIKTVYGNPRPYWIRPYIPGLPGYVPVGIQPYEKYAEYGNPSGHSMFVVALYGYLFYIFTMNHQKKVMHKDDGLRAPLMDEEAPGPAVREKNVNLPAEEAAGLTCKLSFFFFFILIENRPTKTTSQQNYLQNMDCHLCFSYIPCLHL
jgi:membrane-associated phospholipid phosphatase